MTVMDAGKEEVDFTNLYVKCFPAHFKEKDLCDLFSGFGPIQAAKVMTDSRGRSFGFVNFEQPKDAKECVQHMHCKDLRTRKEQKEAKRLEAEGKAPPVKLDTDGHPEHLLYVGRAQKREERDAMLQKQLAEKGLGRGAKGRGKGDGKGDLQFDGGKGSLSRPNPVLDIDSPTAPRPDLDFASPFPTSAPGPTWQQQQQFGYGNGYTNGHGHAPAGSGGGAWSAQEGSGWQGAWQGTNNWDFPSWSGWSGGSYGNGYNGCDGYEASSYSGNGAMNYAASPGFGSSAMRRWQA
mmetsp:Transcript_21251/g.49439  ORF Transcript_21251/g.49439 Transcript_21251/m.49439 type:complete len:292 (+) Transcript_21251:68-943(+)